MICVNDFMKENNDPLPIASFPKTVWVMERRNKSEYRNSNAQILMKMCGKDSIYSYKSFCVWYIYVCVHGYAYTHMYTCVYGICVHAYMGVYMYECLPVRVYMNMHVHMCASTHVHKYICARMYMHMFMCIAYACMCTCTYVYCTCVYVCAYMHLHVCMCACVYVLRKHILTETNGMLLWAIV